MNKLNPWRLGAILSMTVVVNYVLCTIFWYAFNERSITFLNALFHGMDFNKIYTRTALSLGDSLYVLIVLSLWAFVVGVIYAFIWNSIKPHTARV